MPGSASASRCRSLSLFGLLQVTAATDTTEVADPEVRIRVQATDNQTQKRRSELRVRKSCSAEFSSKAMCVGSIMAHAGSLCSPAAGRNNDRNCSQSVLTGIVCSHEHVSHVQLLRKQFKTCLTTWKRP